MIGPTGLLGWGTMVALLLLAPAPGVAAPEPFHNGQSTPFGSIAMTPYVQAERDRTPIEATITVHDTEALGRAHFLMFAFNLHSASVHVRLLSLEVDGRPVAFEPDAEPSNPLQPRVLVAPANLTSERSSHVFVLRGMAWADEGGQYHVGALVMGFAESWTTLTIRGGDPALLYAFTLLSAPGSAQGVPFHGSGNPAGILVVPFAALAVAGTATYFGFRAKP